VSISWSTRRESGCYQQAPCLWVACARSSRILSSLNLIELGCLDLSVTTSRLSLSFLKMFKQLSPWEVWHTGFSIC
jgi:hypothetical protein